MNNNISDNARSIVLSFMGEVNEQDFADARKYIDSEIEFYGVMGLKHGPDAFMNDLKHLQPEYDIKNIFCEGEDVCVLYNFITKGTLIYACGLYNVRNNKITCVRVVFDPRQLLKNHDPASTNSA